MQWQDVLELLNNLKFFFAGLFGAMVSSRYYKDELLTPTDKITFLISGALTAHYLTGLVALHLGLTIDNAGAIGFSLGAFGGAIIQMIVRGFREGAIWQFIKERFLGMK